MARRRRRRPLVADPRVALVLALGAQALAVVLLDDAYEARGKKRPLPLKVVGGLGG